VKLYNSIFLYIILILFQFGCQSESNITVYKIKKNTSLLTQKNTDKINNPQLSWVAPNHWIEKESKDFRLASYNIPTSNGEIVDLSITIFPGDAGGIEQNVNRWRKQINLESQNIETILKNAYKESSLLGKYFIFYLKNKTNGQSIIAAIIPYSDNGQSISETIFIKMNGSVNVLQELKYEFELFCKSIHWLQ
tara:strand:- start:3098 stop:3676 length:579 start_codon:yes stop_codon:yes gene_type:complete